MNNLAERHVVILDIARITVYAAVIMFALLGAVSAVTASSQTRIMRNRGACDEVCTTMRLKSEERDDACWCADADHSIRVAPFAWRDISGATPDRDAPDVIVAAPSGN